MDIELKRQRQREACRRWRERNPDKVKEANRKPRKRIYEPEKRKQWREQRLTKPGYRERENDIANKRARSIRAFLSDYKLQHGCVDCGYRQHFAALDFDHVSGNKSLNVCNAKSVAQAKREIAKCVVRCANCHRIKTWAQVQERLAQARQQAHKSA